MNAPLTGSPARTRAERASLLAIAPTDRLAALADQCLQDHPDPVVVHPPELGMVMLTAREPVESTRFHLGEVLVTRCELVHRDVRGWAMRMGDDAVATVAAAVLDAEREADGPLGAAVDELCEWAAEQQLAERRHEWSDVEPTIVSFEEMD